MKTVGLSAIGLLIAAVVIWTVMIVLDTRARIVSTHVMTSQIYERVFPERAQKPPASPPTPANQSPNAPTKE